MKAVFYVGRRVAIAAAILIGCGGAVRAQEYGLLPSMPIPHVATDEMMTDEMSSSSDLPAASAAARVLNPQEQKAQKFQAVTAVKEAMYFTGIMHGFRYATQPETQKTLYGPFFRNYEDSVKALRGWDDSDSFTTSYMLHPMEGAAFGYIQVQNDPQYRAVQFGDGRAYWISRLRALAFSAALSTQWTLGPFSEASLGNVQIHDSPGFVDLVTTPTLGVAWMVGEDALDHYVVTKFENKYSNPYVLMLARSCFMPTHSWANLMTGKMPWEREGRMGIFGANRATREELLREYHAGLIDAPFGQSAFRRDSSVTPGKFPLAAPIELTTSAHYESFLGGGSCVGGGGSGAVRVNTQMQIVAEGSGCLIMHQPARNESGDSETFAVGPRWTPRSEHKFSPYAQVLIGGRRVTHEIDDEAKHEQLDTDFKAGRLPRSPLRSEYSVEHQEAGFAVAAGGGFDLVVNRAIAWRVANVEYTHTWIGDVDQIRPSDGVKITSGVVLRIGTW